MLALFDVRVTVSHYGRRRAPMGGFAVINTTTVTTSLWVVAHHSPATGGWFVEVARYPDGSPRIGDQVPHGTYAAFFDDKDDRRALLVRLAPVDELPTPLEAAAAVATLRAFGADGTRPVLVDVRPIPEKPKEHRRNRYAGGGYAVQHLAQLARDRRDIRRRAFSRAQIEGLADRV